MCVETEVSGCLDYIEPLQPSVSYGVTPQCPLDSAREIIKGPSCILKWAEIQLNLLYTLLHSNSLAEIFSLRCSMGMERREKSKLQELCCCRQLICDLMDVTGGCL